MQFPDRQPQTFSAFWVDAAARKLPAAQVLELMRSDARLIGDGEDTQGRFDVAGTIADDGTLRFTKTHSDQPASPLTPPGGIIECEGAGESPQCFAGTWKSPTEAGHFFATTLAAKEARQKAQSWFEQIVLPATGQVRPSHRITGARFLGGMAVIVCLLSFAGVWYVAGWPGPKPIHYVYGVLVLMCGLGWSLNALLSGLSRALHGKSPE